MSTMSKSSTTTEPGRDPLGPVHPGEILREEFLEPLALSPGALAKALHVPRTRIERLVKQTSNLSADTALRLSRFFGTSAEFWLAIQARYDIETALAEHSGEIGRITPREAA